MESVQPVSKLSTESVGSRGELVANCVHTADATKQFRRVGVGSVYWALVHLLTFHINQHFCKSGFIFFVKTEQHMTMLYSLFKTNYMIFSAVGQLLAHSLAFRSGEMERRISKSTARNF